MKEKSYKRIVYDTIGEHQDKAIERCIEATDCFIEELKNERKEEVEEFLMCLNGELLGGHFDECTAEYVICKMEPVGMDKRELLRILPCADDVKTQVMESWNKAKMKAQQRSFQAPVLPSEYNAWDMYVTMAMFYADYWNFEISEDMAYDFVYAYLSDPDYPTKSKIWDYLISNQ